MALEVTTEPVSPSDGKKFCYSEGELIANSELVVSREGTIVHVGGDGLYAHDLTGARVVLRVDRGQTILLLPEAPRHAGKHVGALILDVDDNTVWIWSGEYWIRQHGSNFGESSLDHSLE